jgi:hypothetical protein
MVKMSVTRTAPTALKLSEQTTSAIKSIQILKTGAFFTDKYGKFEITKKMLDEMVRNFQTGVRGIVPALDYAHEVDGVAAGWFKGLEVKDVNGEQQLWADIELTPVGQKSLSDKEYGYISADFDEKYRDNEDNKNYGCVLLGAALTNRPVIKRMAAAIQLSEKNDAISEKIALLIKEGKDPEQAKAIAYSMFEQGKLSEDNTMLEQKLAEVEKKLGEYKKLEELMGVEGPEALMKAVGDMKGKKEEEVKEVGEVKKELADLKVKEEGVQKELSELRSKLELKDKEIDFNKMLSEGKVVEAQREAFVSGDIKKFSELAMPMKTKEEGTGHQPADKNEDVDDEILKAAKKLSEEKKVSIKEAISEVLRTNKQLAEKRAAQIG